MDAEQSSNGQWPHVGLHVSDHALERFKERVIDAFGLTCDYQLIFDQDKKALLTRIAKTALKEVPDIQDTENIRLPVTWEIKPNLHVTVIIVIDIGAGTIVTCWASSNNPISEVIIRGDADH